MAYDAKCYELAEAFLSDAPKLNTPAAVDRLAQCIQDQIESELEYMTWQQEEKEAARG